jgi:cell wall-associated NlpC family hydrolase
MEALLRTLYACLNVPYIYGGDNPLVGLDCSGFGQWGLKSVGADPPGDQTAQGLFDHFSRNGEWNKYTPGALAFYGQSATEISHVAFLVSSSQIIEAGGGDHTTTTLEEARKRGACVRIRMIKARPDLVAVIRPNYIV